MKLSSAQYEALAYLGDGVGLATFRGVYPPRTVDSLVARGLVRYYPYGDGGRGTYRVTALGHEVMR